MQPLPPEEHRHIGAYRVVAELGRGAMGRVFLGYGPDGRTVAVKTIRDWLSEDEEFRARFRREVAASLQVAGAYTAAVLDAGVEGPTPWLASEFLPGPTLRAAVDAAGPLPEEAVLRLAAGLSIALTSIHRAGIIHRDFKPGNVILAADGPRVIDFGIAHAADRAGTDLTRTGGVIGTPEFMSPEQAESEPLTPASDVFALGSVLAMAAKGASPFADSSTLRVLNNVVRAEPDLTGVPERIRAVVAPCLEPRPEDRPAPSEVLRLVGPVAPSSRPWPEPVSALADEQRRKLTRLLDGAGEQATLIDDGRTLVADPNSPTWAGAPGPAAPPAGPGHQRPPAHDPDLHGARTATAARRLIWWCLPGLASVIYMGLDSIENYGAPVALILVNVVIALAAIVMIPFGARSLARRRRVGYRLIAAAGTAAGLQGMTTALQAFLTGAAMSFGVFIYAFSVYILGPVTAALAIASVVLALRPSTRRWCLA